MAAKSRRRRKAESQQHNVTAGTTVRMEVPASARKPKPNIAVIMAHEVAQEINPVGGFLHFLREYAVVGLAIGFVIGLQAQTLVKQLVDSFINPLFTLLFGRDLRNHAATLHFNGRSADFSWGAFAYGLLNFLFVLAAIYIIVKVFKLDKLKKLEEVEEEQE